MSTIQINFDEVPDRMEPLPPGVYVLRVEEANLEPTKDGKGEKIVAVMKVDDESNPNHGRVVYDHLSLKMPIGLKQLAKSAGLTVGAGGLNTADLVGKHVRARVKARVYRDAETGETKEVASIAEYLFG